MQELVKRQKQQQEQRKLLAAGVVTRTVEDIVAHLTEVQYKQGVQIFAEQYSSFHNAAAEGSLTGVSHFLHVHGRRRVQVKDLG